MSKLISLFFLAPVLRGFVAILISGAAFPLCGVMVLKLNLVPLRYMLMHGVILGGAIALAANLPMVPAIVIVNIVLVILMLVFSKNSGFGFSGTSAATMVLSMAAASLITHISGVPAKDSLSLLWGSPFALSIYDIIFIAILATGLLIYTILNFKNILSLFFSAEISKANGINVQFHYTFMIFIVALVVAIAMKLLGAFMIDSILILPALIAAKFQKIIKREGIKRLFAFSSLAGFFCSLFGYVIAVALDFPPAATIAALSGILYVILSIFTARKRG